MRIYIPLVGADLAAGEITPRPVHTVTAALRSALPDVDDEGLEYSATLAAADGALVLMQQEFSSEKDTPNLPAPASHLSIDSFDPRFRRIIASAEVEEGVLDMRVAVALEAVPSQVHLVRQVEWEHVDSILIDEPGFSKLIAQALAGDERSFEASGDIDLLWYDVVEREALYEMLGEDSQ
ncbi:MAG: hypothetical protein PUK40_03510 [Actinomycetaceae bacterium]|nr:hypothetical protein [Arcanobacterium sp.]MDD7505007.1 hypothetical protein [Actinomycetaceae bacterium]MDY6143336.1 hypothetical protein [Arcanobacterium sp.]